MNSFLRGAQNVLKTMCFVNPVVSKPFLKKDTKAIGDVSGIIGLIGHQKGALVLTFSEKAILLIVSKMLYEEQTEINRDVKDAVGELTNMISGDSRKRLSALGMNFEAGLPTVITGRNHEIESGMSAGAQTISIPFVVGAGYRFSVEFNFE